MNSQQPSSSPQITTAPSWDDPALAAQYYGFAQQDPYSNSNSFVPSRQNVQSYAPMSFGNPSYQTQPDPAAQMLQNWTTAQSVHGSGIQHPGQQYPVQQAQMYQAPFQQTAYPQTDYQEDSKAIGAYSDDYDNFDPSAQLMAELSRDVAESAYSAAPAPEAVDNKYDDLDQAWDDSVVDAAMAVLNNSPIYDPPTTQSARYQTFRSFEDESPNNETRKVQDEELAHQVDQVVAGLSDEDMEDTIPEEQIEVVRT
jgi:hypothetical protein